MYGTTRSIYIYMTTIMVLYIYILIYIYIYIIVHTTKDIVDETTIDDQSSMVSIGNFPELCPCETITSKLSVDIPM
jgi:hypothetical protein